MNEKKINYSRPILTINNLKKYYVIRNGLIHRKIGYVRAVDDINLTIYRGETLGLVGESGCGKSTLGLTIVGLEKPTSGTILFEGRDLARKNKKFKQCTDIQMIFQDPISSLDPRMSVADIIAEPLKIRGKITSNKIVRRVDSLLDSVGLSTQYRAKFSYELSGGECQRIGIARALALKPKIIICDEPVSALDISVQLQILDLLKDLQSQYNLTYLFIAHGLNAVRYISDYIAVMYMGNIVEYAETESIFDNPQHPYTKALLSANLSIDPNNRIENHTIPMGEIPNPLHTPRGCKFQTRCSLASELCKKFSPKLRGTKHKVACLKKNSNRR
ncbi:MAG: ATP-binding cassette domain-containing protein [Sporolactobacillus sp.]|jgi:oligopeptide/dipeptide ABC transporter ATP-binding protein|nr:ATP-binding cassette domain-containing protein [Sporolactobacillus sp.]